ncbi:MAG: hypothetical protein ACK5KP_07445 [Paludibacteraceae bacterium]
MKRKLQKLLIFSIAACMLVSCNEDELYPAANFTTTGYIPGFKWKLDATGSMSVAGQNLMYRWDYDRDQSQFDTPWSSDPVFISIEGSQFIGLMLLRFR